MDVRIETADPSSVDIAEIVEALEGAGYMVNHVTIVDRATGKIVKAGFAS